MTGPNEGDTIAVWFSSGAASAVAALETIRLYGDKCTIRVINNPIEEEDIDNKRFLKDVERLLGISIEFATNKDYPLCSAVDVWEKRKYMSGPAGAPCTGELKKRARQQWEAENKCDWLVLGFTAEEEKRHNRFVRNERSNLLPVLISQGITKSDCYARVESEGIALPRIYSMGYPNANCIGCVKATSPTYWNHVRKMHPGVFSQRAAQSDRLGVKLVRYKGKRISLKELPADAKGRSMKNMDFECGIFCEEKI